MRPQTQDTPLKRGMMFNKSPGMSEIFGRDMEDSGSIKKQSIGAEYTFGVPRQALMKSEVDNNTEIKHSSKDPLLDKGMNDELLQYVQQKNAEQHRREKEEHLKYLQNLKEMEQRERFRNSVIKDNYGIAKTAKQKDTSQFKHPDCDPTTQEYFAKINHEAEKAMQQEKIRKNQEKKEYNFDLSQQCKDQKQKLANDKKFNREEELSKIGLPLDSYKGDRYAIEKRQQQKILKDQMIEHQVKKLRGSQDEPKAMTKMEELTQELELKRASEDQKVKDTLKKDYKSFIQEKEIQTQKTKEQREQRMKDVLQADTAYKTEIKEQRQLEKEKKKILGEYLLSQIQAKAKEIQPNEEEIVEHASRPDPTKPKPQNNPREVKDSNIRQMQEKEIDRAYEREKQKRLDEEMLRKAQEEEELFKQQEQQKKDIQKRTMEEAQRKTEIKRSQQINNKKGDRTELEYYEKMNEQFKDLIKEEQDTQNKKLLDYKDQLKYQILQNDEAKHKNKLAKLKEMSGGLQLGKDPNPYIDRRKYQEEIGRQYRESQISKSPRKSESIPTESIPPLGEEYKPDWSKEKQRKKILQKEDFLQAQEFINRKKIEKEQSQQLLKEEREREAQTIKQLQEAERKRDRDQKKNLAAFLDDQIKVVASKKNIDRSQWMDERAKQHAEEIEKRVKELKNEIVRCIKCKAPLLKSNQNKFQKR